jgi:hypothetical protein
MQYQACQTDIRRVLKNKSRTDHLHKRLIQSRKLSGGDMNGIETICKDRQRVFFGDYLHDQVDSTIHCLRKLKENFEETRFTCKLLKLYKVGGCLSTA